MITTLKTKGDTVLTSSRDILGEFESYYRSLYSSNNPSEESIENFLKSTNFHKSLLVEHREMLDSPITEAEIVATLKLMKSGKATGRDGFPVEFYKSFSDLLVNPLVETCNFALSKGRTPQSWGKARIIVIPKPGKDPQKVESYRPISLLNHDAKIFASLLARRLNKVISCYIHPDQAGFIPSRQLTENIRKTLNVIDFCSKNNTQLVVMTLDAEKAFDRVETSYLIGLLQKLSFGSHFLNAIKALYANPRAQIFVNNLRSDDFRLTRGTRQGCPLSPLLFAIFLEPLAEAIRTHPDISGVDIASNTHNFVSFR